MKPIISIIIILAMVLSCKTLKQPTSANSINIESYEGLWYEIARYPNSFEKNCDYVTAQYTIRGHYIEVINSCKTRGLKRDIHGKAFPVKGSNNTKLKVQFFWPFKGGYWILATDENYRWALIGSRSKRYCWILSRTPQLDEANLNEIFEIMKQEGYQPDMLYFTKQ